MTPQNAIPQRKKWPAWAKALLIASLALNLLVLGLFAGQMMKKRGGRDVASQQVSWILRFVPENQRDKTKEHFAKVRGELVAANLERRETMTTILGAIQAEDFSTETLQTAMDARLANKLKRNKLIQDQLISLLSDFTPEERMEFATNLSKGLEKRQAKRGQ